MKFAAKDLLNKGKNYFSKTKNNIPVLLTVFFVLAIFIGAIIIAFTTSATVDDDPAFPASLRENLYRARIVSITEEIVPNTYEIIQTVYIRILNRDLRDTETSLRITLAGDAIPLREGNRIVVNLNPYLNPQGEMVFEFRHRDRTLPLLFLFLFFVVCVIFLGRFKGVRALLALTLTFALIFFILVPLLLLGWNPIILAILTCIIATTMTVTICFGIGKKSLSALIGISGGLVIAGLIAYLFGIFATITGISQSDAHYIVLLEHGNRISLRGLLFAGIIIGALGACQDVAISVSSSMTELTVTNPDIERKELLKSSFNVGRDIMGSMVNTLVLAYTGGAIVTIMVFLGRGGGLSAFINREFMATEILRAVAGSLGLLFTIPLTIFAFLLLDSKARKKKQAFLLKKDEDNLENLNNDSSVEKNSSDIITEPGG